MAAQARRRLWVGILSIAVLVAALTAAAVILVPDMQGLTPVSSTGDQDPSGSTTSPSPSAAPAPTGSSVAATPTGSSAAAPTDDTSASPSSVARPSPAGSSTVISTPQPTCTAPAKAPGGITHVVNVGYEDITSSDPHRLAYLAQKLDQVKATGVRIAVGRLDWVGFPWAGHEDLESSDVKDTGRDYVQEAIAALGCDASGHRRTIYLGVDALFGREVTDHPELAGVDQSGKRSTLFASLTAWKTGPLTPLLADFVHELAVRYHPDDVNITELYFDANTFGADDFADFKATEHVDAWPRSHDGTVDRTAPSVANWRSGAIASVVERVQQRLAGTGVRLTFDVRAPVALDPLGRPDLGANYPLLLKHVDQIVVWDFPGMVAFSVLGADQLGPLLFTGNPDRYELGIGLWKGGTGGGRITAAQLRHELDSAKRQGIKHVSVTPTSLFTEETWSILQSEWATG